MLIRRANKTDVSIIHQLQNQLFEEESIYGFAPDSIKEINKSINHYLLVVEIKNEVIGFISGVIKISEGLAVIPEGESYLEIENLYVVPQFRKQGIGGKLVDELLAEAKRNKIAYASLYSATKDVHGILKFYERHNFQSWYIQMFRKL
jgi:ribosomal protein S18 acetylase RimI-like enzyme